MIFVTSMLTGLFAGLLRSAFSVIIVAFLIAITFLMASVFYGAPVIGLVLASAGFNVGLTVLAVGYAFVPKGKTA